ICRKERAKWNASVRFSVKKRPVHRTILHDGLPRSPASPVTSVTVTSRKRAQETQRVHSSALQRCIAAAASALGAALERTGQAAADSPGANAAAWPIAAAAARILRAPADGPCGATV